MTPETNTIWQFIGPGKGVGQLHQVVFSDSMEVVTAGMPYGQGYAWIGTPSEFRNQFVYKAQMP